MRTVTGTVKVWANQWIGPDDLNHENVIQRLTYTNLDMATSNYSLVGSAEITVDFVDQDELILNKVEALRTAQKAARAEAQKMEMQYEKQIQQLLAITMDTV